MAGTSALLYHCNGPEWASLRNTMMLLRFRLRVITPQQYNQPLSLLSAGKQDDSLPPFQGEDFNEPLLVMCNIGDAQLKPILEVLRRMDLPAPLMKAVMTPTNATWNSMELYNHICEERDAVMAGKKG